ncbi:hypothetical protein ED733_008987 [Metarhizium rileyi]|uniref:Beta-glucuronidase C-terminal domain-containing protein n=1 Tax=Metarhizium rileyi (strain RCEF 4871) TaxID=1649241 RepID=A0A5C6GM32_METRR|nr:hypothetical protein ED733_008987 [Metarhizium rileyi]
MAVNGCTADPFLIKTRRDPLSGPLESFVSFSIELSSFVDYAGNLSTPNIFSYNLLSNFEKLMGSKPYVRVGGNTQDFALYNASLKEAINGTYDLKRSKDYPTTIYIGNSFFESYKTWPGVKFSHGFNLAKGAVSAEGWETLKRTAELACKALGNNNLDVWEYGNEPNNFPTAVQGPTRPKGWSAKDYTNEWLNGTREIQEQIRKHCPTLADSAFMAPSYDARATKLNATQVWGYGLDKRNNIKWYSVHNYIDGATSPGVTLQGTLMNHSRTIRDVDGQAAEYKRAMGTNHGDAPLIFGETNSLYSQGKPGLSNSFGAALWVVDFNLYSASAGFRRVHMHQGTDYRYQAFQPVDTNKTTKGTKAPYYGSIGVAAALGDVTKSSVSVSSVPMSSDRETAYAIYEDGYLKRLMVINMHGYNTTRDGAGLHPLPDPPGRGSWDFSFSPQDLKQHVSFRVQRLMANGSDAITGVTFDGWSYNWELDNGNPVRLHNTTTGEMVKSKHGVFTVRVPDSSAALLHMGYDD